MQVGERYVLQKLLGTGTFSTVCAATDTITQETVRHGCRSHLLLLTR